MVIFRVLADGQEMCAKVADDLRANSVQREMSTLWRITASQYADTIRVPKLRGLVYTLYSGDERVIGFLEDYIREPKNSELSTLRDVKKSSVSV